MNNFNSPFESAQRPEVRVLSAGEFRERQATAPGQVIDVRTVDEYNSGHLKGAINADYRSGQVEQLLHTWDKTKPCYLHCAGGTRSAKAAEVLLQHGFQEVYNIGGFGDLKRAGLPVE